MRESRQSYEHIFPETTVVIQSAKQALLSTDLPEMVRLMNENHRLLQAIQVTCTELDNLMQLARDHGALGAKLTGAGGGGSIVALADENSEAIAAGLNRHGFKALQVAV